MTWKSTLKNKKLIAQQVAKLHIENLSESFLASLGEKFLTEIYISVQNDEESKLICEYHKDRIIGFVSAGISMSRIYKGLFIRVPMVLLAIAPSLLNPMKLVRIFNLIIYSLKNTDTNSFPSPELWTIAVDGRYRRKGISSKLYESVIKFFKDKRVISFKILVSDNLKGAHMFYEKLGAKKNGKIELHGGSTSTIYIQKIRG